MSRTWLWTQLLVGWLPIWALFTVMVVTAHDTAFGPSALIALRLIVAAAALGLVVHRFTLRRPWPHPFRPSFVVVHACAAALFSLTWVTLNSAIESLVRGHLVFVLGPGLGPYLVTGVWMYVMVAAVAYAEQAAQRAARVETAAARAQLAALRAQLHPHFLFNALHTVVQLIPDDPRGAARAAEQLAGALRVAIEEQRDRVPLADEWDFVQRYLAIEQIRFGSRLIVTTHMDDAALDALLPSFALQTLVENAVVHGAAPRVEPTTITISGRIEAGMLLLDVVDDGAGANSGALEHGPLQSSPIGAGTGLRRLREQLDVLYRGRARMIESSRPGDGWSVALHVPLDAAG